MPWYNALTFDTLKLARKLEAAGFSATQAGDTSAVPAEAVGEVTAVAIKEDIQRLERKIEGGGSRLDSQASPSARYRLRKSRAD